MTYVNNLAAAMTGTPEYKEKQERGLAALQASLNRIDLAKVRASFSYLEMAKDDISSVTYKAVRAPFELCELIRSFISNQGLNLSAVVDGHNWVKVSVKEA